MNLFGYVKNPTNMPVSEAIVEVHPYGKKTTTDVNGYFLFQDLYVGKYEVYVTHPNYAKLQKEIDLSPSIVPLTWMVSP